MTHPTTHNPTTLYLPLTARVVTHLDTVATCQYTPTSIDVTFRNGANTDQTAVVLVKLVDDATLLGICAAWGIHLPAHVVRHDPVAALGPIAHLIISAALIPPCLDPARIRA